MAKTDMPARAAVFPARGMNRSTCPPRLAVTAVGRLFQGVGDLQHPER